MREILFRAKRLDNGEWAESRSINRSELEDGSLLWFIGAGQPAEQWVSDKGNLMAVETTGECLLYACDPKTIGQFTGLTDTNGTKIFEGDIVECAREDEPLKVEWCEDSARFILSASTFCCDFDNYWGYETEVIGNIHDSPELLEG